MNPIISSFLKDTGIQSDESTKSYQNLIFVLVNEFHWSQRDIEESDMPFVLELLNARKRMLEEQERQSKRRR